MAQNFWSYGANLFILIVFLMGMFSSIAAASVHRQSLLVEMDDQFHRIIRKTSKLKNDRLNFIEQWDKEKQKILKCRIWSHISALLPSVSIHLWVLQNRPDISTLKTFDFHSSLSFRKQYYFSIMLKWDLFSLFSRSAIQQSEVLLQDQWIFFQVHLNDINRELEFLEKHSKNYLIQTNPDEKMRTLFQMAASIDLIRIMLNEGNIYSEYK